MEFYEHPDCNTRLMAPAGEEDSVAALPVTQGFVGPEKNLPVTRSYWVPSEADLILLQTGRYCIALTVMGATHAPVRVDVCDAKVDVSRIRAMSNDKIYVPPGTKLN